MKVTITDDGVLFEGGKDLDGMTPEQLRDETLESITWAVHRLAEMAVMVAVGMRNDAAAQRMADDAMTRIRAGMH